jgi:hypothetical protein
VLIPGSTDYRLHNLATAVSGKNIFFSLILQNVPWEPHDITQRNRTDGYCEMRLTYCTTAPTVYEFVTAGSLVTTFYVKLIIQEYQNIHLSTD